MELAARARRAHSQYFNVHRRNTQRLKVPPVRFRKIYPRLPVQVAALGEESAEFHRNFWPHFITATPDSRSDSDQNVQWLCTKLSTHRLECLTAHFLDRAAPACMNCGHRVSGRIGDEYRNAVGSAYRYQYAGGLCNEGVALAKAGISGIWRKISRSYHPIRVNLLEADQARGVRPAVGEAGAEPVLHPRQGVENFGVVDQT